MFINLFIPFQTINSNKMRAFLLCLWVAAVSSQQLVKIGDLQTLQHGVSGEVYAVDESHMRIKHFSVSNLNTI